MDNLYTYDQLSDNAKETAYTSYLDLVKCRQCREYLTIDKFCNWFYIDYEVDDDDEPFALPTFATTSWDSDKYELNGQELADFIAGILNDIDAYPRETAYPLTGYPFDNVLLKRLYDFVEKPNDNTDFDDILIDALFDGLETAQEDFQKYNSIDMFPFKCRKDNLQFYESGEICA